jgi:sulfite exporter TauE/SafE
MNNDILLIFSLISLGFFGGFSHCVGMCGPFVLTQVLNRMQNNSLQNFSEFKRIKNLALLPYHFGRLTTYSLIGFVCCKLTKKITEISGLKIFAGFFLLFAAAVFVKIFFEQSSLKNNPYLKFNKLSWRFSKDFLRFFTLPIKSKFLKKRLDFSSSKISILLKYLFQNPLGFRGYFLGVLLGFIPCGLLYGAFAMASGFSNQFLALFGMFCFGLATFPSLFLTALGGNFLFKFFQFQIFINTLFLINFFMLILMAIKLLF